MIRFSVFCTTVIFLLSLNKLTAQDKKKPDPQTFKDGKISGIVVDAATLEPLEGCSCSLVRNVNGKLVKGVLTGKDGSFELQKLTFGYFDVRVTYVGYKTQRITKIMLLPDKYTINLDTLKLNASAITAKTVEITAKKERVEYDGDKLIFTLGTELQDMGGSAVDVLEFVPKLSVDVDGNVKMIGRKGVKIYIDGIDAKFLGFDNSDALRSFPAADIERIEVLSDPSIEYDAGGDQGVINIITKRNIVGSYGGRINAGASTKDRYNSGLGLNYNYKDFSSGIYYQNSYSIMKSSRSSLRISSLQNNTSYLMQSDNTDNKGSSNGIRLNLGYQFSKLSRISSSAAFRNNYSDNSLNLLNRYSSDGIVYGSRLQSSRLSSINRNFFNYSLNYITNSADNSASFEVFFVYMNNAMENKGRLNQERIIDSLFSSGILSSQNNSSLNKNNSFSLTARFSKEIPEAGKILVGYEGNLTDLSMKNNYYNYNYLIQDWKENLNDKADQDYSEQKHSLYTGYFFESRQYIAEAGFRLENFRTGSTENILNETKNYSFLGFLPSLRFSWNLAENSITARYSRRIGYPLNRQLNPHVDYSDSTNITSGNPDLKPSNTDGYVIIFGFNDLPFSPDISFTYTKTRDIIEPYTGMENLTTARTTYRNMSTLSSYTTNLLLQYNMIRKFSVFISSSLGKNNYKNPAYTSNSMIFSSWASLSFSLGKYKFSTSLQYASSEVSTQEKTKGYFKVDMGVNARFLDNRLIVSLKANDPFNLMKTDSDRYGAGFVYRNYSKEDTRIFTLNITYSLQKIIEEKEEIEEIIEYKDDF